MYEEQVRKSHTLRSHLLAAWMYAPIKAVIVEVQGDVIRRASMPTRQGSVVRYGTVLFVAREMRWSIAVILYMDAVIMEDLKASG